MSLSYLLTEEEALQLDREDSLSAFRNEFHIPLHEGKPIAYFCGNSLGLQPKETSRYLNEELEDWAKLGVEGHFRGRRPWFSYHHFFAEQLANITGSKPIEVVAMNNLSVNLHLLMVSFYRPFGNRYKIIMEAGAFPSDMYVVQSQVEFHGYNYNDAVIELKPRSGEFSLRNEDILDAIRENGSETALVFFSGVQYYTGQLFDIAGITAAAHEAGAIAGFDLAHAAGNVKLQLHDWDVDFAAWCSYKYLNSGPGGVSGIFIHEKHSLDPATPRFAGWWGHKEDIRFKMERGFIPEPGAQGWQLSNAPVLTMAAHKASLDIYSRAGMDALTEKANKLNEYAQQQIEAAIAANPDLQIRIITPPSPWRGCQISMLSGDNGKAIFNWLENNGVVADWREPNVIRMAAVPLYNSFHDVWRLGDLLKKFRA